jgi:lipopolysaccharide/colanic/teichoic acid biosynthesis glycosyltransferase
MSLVGPRPDVPGYADRLSGEARAILDIRPGITGPATLYFRFEERLLAGVPDPVRFNDEVLWPLKVAMNIDYLKSRSFLRDIGFILITLAPALNRFLKLVPEPPLDPEALRRLSTLSS